MKIRSGIKSYYSAGTARASYRKARAEKMLRMLANPNLLVDSETYDAVIDELAERIDRGKRQ